MENSKTKILIISASQKNARHLEAFLKKADYDTFSLSSGEEAVDQINQINPTLILAEYHLPDMLGIRLTSNIRSKKSMDTIPLFFFATDPVRHDEKLACFKAGADDFLVHPVKMDELMVRIESLLRRTKLKPKTDLMEEIQSVVSKSPAIQEEPEEETNDEPPIFKDEDDSRPQPITPFQFDDTPVDEDEEDEEPEDDGLTMPIRFFHRIKEVFHKPQELFTNINIHHDFFISLILVITTPIVASFSFLTQSGNSFDAWIGSLSFGIATSAIVWMGLGGFIHIVFPFQGLNISTKKALVISGLAFSPKLLGALLSAIYGLVFQPGLQSDSNGFSAGISLIPGLPVNDWIAFISRVGLFDFWSTWITLTALWVIGKPEKKWNTLTIIVGLVSLAFGAFSTY